MLLSRDLVARLVSSRDELLLENDGAHADDVAVGRWVASRVCDVPLETIVERIESGVLTPA